MEKSSSASARNSRQLLLILVSYRTPIKQVQTLKLCLSGLDKRIGYSIVVNDYRPGEPITELLPDADYSLALSANLGYGRAVNTLVDLIDVLPDYIGVLNTDLSWTPRTFEDLLVWLQQHPEVCLAVPQILDENGNITRLCKQNPTFLGLFSRRFWPECFKPAALRRYDRWYCMESYDYEQILDVPYLSGCCMLISSMAFRSINGFDPRFFMYLEDADITRRLSAIGRCVHLPVGKVCHGWGRGNYKSLRLMAINLVSAWHYFRKWGLAFW